MKRVGVGLVSKDILNKVYNEVVSEIGLRNSVIAIGFDTWGYLVNVAINSLELTTLLTHNRLSGVAVDGLEVGYDIERQRSVVDIDLTPENIGTDYATEQLLLASNKEVNKLEQELLYGNRLTMKMKEFLDENSSIGSELSYIHLSDNANGRLPMFRTLTIYGPGFDLFITGQQISFLTKVGLVKVHDVNKDVDAAYLANLMSKLCKVDFNAMYDVISM